MYHCTVFVSSVGSIVGGVIGGIVGLIILTTVLIIVCKACNKNTTRGAVVNVSPNQNTTSISTVHTSVQPMQPTQQQYGYGYPSAYPPQPPTYAAPPSSSNPAMPPPNYAENITTSQPPAQTKE
ncbi:hypothetical protein KUTeg_020916 [Tegillarca granosa]|uniref:Uncharacterized protein n=1 Tax=Tegillarca granosa TaxID=220873 RepID=A0ABQ9E9B3_TEGGR|nr:hypothetical protein KUTeg_020916 [Tegillarca granosa]